MAHLTASQLIWDLVERQHGVIAHRQLVALGMTADAIKHRVRTGRLRRLWRGVYAVGRPSLSDEGWWMAATLACGEGAVLSHASAAALSRVRAAALWPIHISVPRARAPRRSGIVVHRRNHLRPEDVTETRGIPVTGPALTLIDLATTLSDKDLERVLNETDKLELLRLVDLRRTLDGRHERGSARLRRLIDRPTFVLTDSELERLFVPIAVRAGLPKPETQALLYGHRVDFFFRKLGLVVETDGLRYHRTPTQQNRDRMRDQELTGAGLRVLRFTHAQIKYDPAYVERILTRTATARDRAVPRARGGRTPPPLRRVRAGSA